MSCKPTAFEILQVAEQMEREAARFYRKAAGMYDDPGMSRLFADLAQWEKRHVQVFAEIRDRLAKEHTWQRDRPVLDRMDASQLEMPFPMNSKHSDPTEELAGNEARADVLALALKKERHAIGYYTSLTELVLGQDNLAVIKDIVKEERRHVRILLQSLRQAAGR